VYYWKIETGVASRITGTREGDESFEAARERVKQIANQVKAEWDQVQALDEASKIIEYFAAHQQQIVANAISTTLEKNKYDEPMMLPERHKYLQTAAVFRGLARAWYEVNGLLPPVGTGSF
jgi:hypothetical protein